VCLTASNACGADVFCDTVDLTDVGIAEASPEWTGQMVIQPNPFSRFTRLFLPPQVAAQTYALRLINTDGQVVWKSNGLTGSGQIIPRNNLPAGLYLLEWQGLQRAAKRIVIP